MEPRKAPLSYTTNRLLNSQELSDQGRPEDDPTPRSLRHFLTEIREPYNHRMRAKLLSERYAFGTLTFNFVSKELNQLTRCRIEFRRRLDRHVRENGFEQERNRIIEFVRESHGRL